MINFRAEKPIEFIQAVNPIVIIDEPQSVDSTSKAKEAIKQLNPLFQLRYSATHRDPYNLTYRLDPIRAFQLGLVKGIRVTSVLGSEANNSAFIKFLSVDNTKGIRAKLRIHSADKNGIKEKDVTVKDATDLYELSGERDIYKDGYEITEINAEPGNEYIDFSKGLRLYLGEEIGGIKEDLANVQIRATVQKHLDKELEILRKGLKIKVLSLFFLDKVANYRLYNEDGKPEKGKYAEAFEQHYLELIKEPRYSALGKFEVEKIHDGYFSTDKKGILKDTKGDSKDDDDTYAKIMRNKEQLLSADEPLKFIFSHSALREGWDNPNVFQICTLNETQSVTKKRQEIGRGLRLPVNAEGERVFSKDLNQLTIIANEKYEDFARKLQTEYEDDCGVKFGHIPQTIFSEIAVQDSNGDAAVLGITQSIELWKTLQKNGFIDVRGKILNTFSPDKKDFSLQLPENVAHLEGELIQIMQGYQMIQHVQPSDDDKIKLTFRKHVELTEEFKMLWEKISHKTFYRVRYDTKELIKTCIRAIKEMEKVEAVKIKLLDANVDVTNKGISVQENRVRYEKLKHQGKLPDILSYIQKQTELTRRTITEILVGSGKLDQFIVNPQRFMDAIVEKINRVKQRLMIENDGIEYQKMPNGEVWAMQLF